MAVAPQATFKRQEVGKVPFTVRPLGKINISVSSSRITRVSTPEIPVSTSFGRSSSGAAPADEAHSSPRMDVVRDHR